MTGMHNMDDLPGDLPNDRDEPGSAELAAELVREQATGPVPLGPAAPGKGEDVVLLVETVSFPDQTEVFSPEGMLVGELDLGDGSPWYRSRWLYVGAGLASGAVLAAGVVLLLRDRNARQKESVLGSAQHLFGQWSDQLGDQTGKLMGQIKKSGRQTGWLAGAMNSLTDQASDLTDQAQRQFNQLAKRSQASGIPLLTRQSQSNANTWLKQTQHQLRDLSQQAGDQLGSLGDAIGSTTSQALDKTQEGLAQIRQGLATGVAKTGEGIETGWKFSRNFTLGMAAGAIWAALFTPQSGETTREHLSTLFQSRSARKH